MRYLNRRSCRLVIISFVILMVLFWKFFQTYGLPGPWSRSVCCVPGAICILTSNEKMYIVIEIELCVTLPDPLASPKSYELGSEQYIYCIDKNDWETPVKIAPQSILTFNPNVARIMRSQDNFYLVALRKPSISTDIYIIKRDGFTQLTTEESIALTKRIGYKKSLIILFIKTLIDTETERSGWRIAYLHRGPFFGWHDPMCDYSDLSRTQVKFSWDGKNFAIKGYNRIPPDLLRLVEVGNEDKSFYDLVSFDSRDISVNNYNYWLIQNCIDRNNKLIKSYYHFGQPAAPARVALAGAAGWRGILLAVLTNKPR